MAVKRSWLKRKRDRETETVRERERESVSLKPSLAELGFYAQRRGSHHLTSLANPRPFPFYPHHE